MVAESISQLPGRYFKPFPGGKSEPCVTEGRAQPAHALGIRSRSGDSMTVLGPNSNEIGVLDQKTAAVLMRLKRVSGTIVFSLFLGNEEDLKRHDFKERRHKAPIPVDINIQGPVQEMKEVGKILSDAGMFLQEPKFLGHDVIYQNPHFLAWNDETTTPLLSKSDISSGNDFANSVEEVMSYASAPSHSSTLVQNRQIKTALKRFDPTIQM